MIEMIEERILEGWSPEQIAGRFKLAGNSISYEYYLPAHLERQKFWRHFLQTFETFWKKI